MYGRARYLAIALLLPAGCGGSGGASGACPNLACLQAVEALMVGCAAAGACVRQESATTTPLTSTACFDNGVKIMQTTDATLGTASFTSSNTAKVEKNGTLCYTRTFVNTSGGDAGPGITIDITTQDAAGTTLMTTRIDANDVATVTCPGLPPTVVVDSCGASTLAVRGAFVEQSVPATCTDGPCSF